MEALDSYRLSGDGEKVVVLHDKQIRVSPANAKADEESGQLVKVDLSRIRVQLDPLSVWGQAFDEAWRLQRDFFWTEDMAGQDWDSVHARYRPIVDRLGSHDDLVDLLWELHGELGTSHAYVRPVAVTENGSNGQGRLGADLAFTGEGWEITRILAGESSDPLATSPLTRPGADAKAGDVLLAIDGVELTEARTPAMQLVGAAGRAVELTLRNGAGHGDRAGQQRRVAVVPVRDEERLRYQEWVSANRRTVRQASQGTFGYLHIPDMMANGWAQLHRDLDTETALDGLIVDVRRNRGGHTSQLVAELIGRKVTGWSMPRGEQPRTYPHHAPRGPVIILADEFAGSDGDIITQVCQAAGDRSGHRHPDLGRRRRHRQPLRPGRRHRSNPAPLRHMVLRRCGVGGRELRRRPGHRGDLPAARVCRRKRPAAGIRHWRAEGNDPGTAHRPPAAARGLPPAPAGPAAGPSGRSTRRHTRSV